MKKKIDRKIISGLIISLLSTQMLQAVAQGVSTQPSGSSSTTVPSLATTAPSIGSLPNLSVIDPNGAPPDCNKEIMQNLNSGYLLNRGSARLLQYNNQMNGLVMTTPKADQMDCFQQAMQNIKNLMSSINAIIALFSLQPDMDAFMQQIVNMVLKAACQEINQVTGSISGSLNSTTSAINGTVGGINNTQVGPTGISIGSVLNPNSTSVTRTDVFTGTIGSVNNTLGTVNTTTTNLNNSSTDIVGKINSVNPFGGK